jgi:hypothetical protein
MSGTTPGMLSLTEAQTLTALRSVLLAYVGSIEVFRAQVNRVPEPQGVDYIEMTPITRERLSTNVDVYSDGFLRTPKYPGTSNALQPTQVGVQLDIHGPNSADTTQIISTMFRDRAACALFTATGFDVQLLFASEPHQAPFINAENQYETRWSMDVELQANPIVTTAQDFAAVVTVGLINVDAKFPPV